MGRIYYAPDGVLDKMSSNNERTYYAPDGGRSHNEGGILGGIGYVTGKMLTGIASVGEGITDLVAGGIAELSGDHRRATYIFGHSEVGEWNEALDDWYNPDAEYSLDDDTYAVEIIEEEFDTEQAEDDDYDETEYDVIKKKSLRLAVCPYGNAKRKHLFC